MNRWAAFICSVLGHRLEFVIEKEKVSANGCSGYIDAKTTRVYIDVDKCNAHPGCTYPDCFCKSPNLLPNANGKK